MRLDYGNATLAGLPDNLIRRLQSCVFVTEDDSVTPLLQQLHWLKVEQQIKY